MKKTRKKLALQTETLRTLGETELARVGGGSWAESNCVNCLSDSKLLIGCGGGGLPFSYQVTICKPCPY